MAEIINNKLIITWLDIEEDCKKVCKKIINAKKKYKGIVVVTRGGFGIAAYISRILNICISDVMCVGSYNHKTYERSELSVYKYPTFAQEDEGDGWLVIDDVIESGETYKFIKKILPKSDVICLYNKSQLEDIEKSVIYAKKYPSDRWIVFPWEIEL